jgi:four helix bundle protein
MHVFRRLQVRQRSRELAVVVDRLTRRFPRADRAVVASQLRRPTLSIHATIAEGCGKSSRKETVRFLQMACASAAEAESHVVIASDLGYLSAADGEELTGRFKVVQRMLCSLMNKLPP